MEIEKTVVSTPCPNCGGVVYAFKNVAVWCENSDEEKGEESTCDYKLMSG